MTDSDLARHVQQPLNKSRGRTTAYSYNCSLIFLQLIRILSLQYCWFSANTRPAIGYTKVQLS